MVSTDCIIIVIIICVIILILFTLYEIIKCIRRHNTQNENKTVEYNMVGGNDGSNELDTASIPSRFPQVGVLTNRIIRDHSLDEFVYLDKTDGLHVNDLGYARISQELAKYLYNLKS